MDPDLCRVKTTMSRAMANFSRSEDTGYPTDVCNGTVTTLT